MRNIVTYRLGIELTQRCNLDCKHCFRGESKNVNISREIVEKIFDEVAYVEILDLSGGEVFLGYEELKMVLEVAKEKQTVIRSCSLLTNGTIYVERIYDLLDTYFGNNYQVGISDDDYHRKSIERRYGDSLEQISKTIEKHAQNPHFSGFYRVSNRLINNGRAISLDTPKKDFEAVGYYYDLKNDELLLAGPLIFISADGFISDINSDNEKRSEQSLGNIKKANLSSCIINGGIKIECIDIIDFFAKMKKRDNDFGIHMGDHLTFKDNKMAFIEYKVDDAYQRAVADIPNVIKAFREAVLNDTIDEFFKNWDPIYDGDLSQTEHSFKL